MIFRNPWPDVAIPDLPFSELVFAVLRRADEMIQ